MPGVKTQIEGLEETKELLESLVELDMKKPFERVKNQMILQANKSFETETSPTGKPWERPKAKTVREKTRLGFPDALLQRTGRLKNSTSDTSAWSVTEDTLTFEPKVLYGKFHQEGTKNLPAREFLDDLTCKQDFENEINNYVNSVIERRNY